MRSAVTPSHDFRTSESAAEGLIFGKSFLRSARAVKEFAGRAGYDVQNCKPRPLAAAALLMCVDMKRLALLARGCALRRGRIPLRYAVAFSFGTNARAGRAERGCGHRLDVDEEAVRAALLHAEQEVQINRAAADESAIR